MEEIIKLLRIMCRLLAEIEHGHVKSAAPRKIYGSSVLTRYVCIIEAWPLYPDYAGYDVAQAVRSKATRMAVAAEVESKLYQVLAGYKVKVRIEP
jgi:hypothetical protein